mgnify:CR=1 FL=1
MNKLKLLITVLFSLTLMVSPSVSKEIRIGASAGFAHLEATGSETLKDSSVVTSHTEQANAVIPSLFAEIATDNGYGMGIDYIAGTADLAGSSRSKIHANTGSGNDANTNTANAEVDGITTVYLIKMFENGIFVKAGMSAADVNTTETLNTGTTYGNKSVDGKHFGFGYEQSKDSGLFFRAGLEHTDFDTLNLTGTQVGGTAGSFNTIKADVDITAAKFSIGKKF